VKQWKAEQCFRYEYFTQTAIMLPLKAYYGGIPKQTAIILCHQPTP